MLILQAEKITDTGIQAFFRVLAETLRIHPVWTILVLFFLLTFLSLFAVVVLFLTQKIPLPSFVKRRKGSKLHTDCQFYEDHRAESDRAFQRGMEFLTLRNKRIERSMQEVEYILDDIESVMLDKWRELASKKHPKLKEKELSLAVLAYQGQVRECLDYKEKRIALGCVRQNHFDSMTEGDFKLYVTKNIDRMLHVMKNFMDDLYHPSLLTRKEVYEESAPVIEEISRLIFEGFYKLRDVSRDFTSLANKALDAQGVTDPEQRERELRLI